VKRGQRMVKDESKLAKKAAKRGEAVMIGILATRFKMGQISVEDLEQMVADTTKTERCSAAKRLLETIKDLPVPPESTS
jgi:hypothetical protein